MPNLEKITETTLNESSFAKFAEGVSDYLQPLGFPKNATQPLAEYLMNIHSNGQVKAVVINLTVENADGMIFPPYLVFNVILKSPQDLSDQEETTIETIGRYHDKFARTLHNSPIDANISILNPEQYPASDNFKPQLETRRIGSAVRKPIAYLLFDKTTPILTTLS